MRSLKVLLNQATVGALREGDDLWQFQYDPAWQANPEGFDLSPALPRSQALHADGGSLRPVQWYFDNLLPEEDLRAAVSREAGIRGDDAFALLEYLGRESAGSLVLLSPDSSEPEHGGLKPLPDQALSRRIGALPRQPLSTGAPKRMSAAGAQNKLLVVYQDGALFEPVGAEPSTHILKPDNTKADYPATVLNEFFTMRLASLQKMHVPQVMFHRVPEPVYLVERFDRFRDTAGRVQRRHIIDACQLLNKSRGFKYSAATLQSLAAIVDACTNRARTRLHLFRWLLFNLLVGNNDNHLKNLSFHVNHEGISLAPAYDLLCTVAYHTPAFADERADWPHVPLTIPLPNCATYAQVNRSAVIAAGAALGLPPRLGNREIDTMCRLLPPAVEALSMESGTHLLARERRLFRVIRHIVVPEMIARLQRP